MLYKVNQCYIVKSTGNIIKKKPTRLCCITHTTGFLMQGKIFDIKTSYCEKV